MQSAPSTTTATSTGAGTPTRSTSGVASQSGAAAPLAAAAPAPIYRLLARSTLRGVVHGTPYSYKLAI